MVTFARLIEPSEETENIIFEKAETIKQALDACTSNFMQILGNEFLAQHKLESYLKFLRSE